MTGLEVGYLSALGAGVLSFLSPCVLPLVPPYLCFVSGLTLDQVASGPEADRTGRRRRVFLAAGAFVLGFSTVFIALGATASALGRFLAQNMDTLAQVAGILLVVLGIHFLGLVRIPLLDREARFQVTDRPVGLVGAYVVGLAFAFGWTPCVGPVLAAVLMVAGGGETIWYGSSLLAAYALGLGIPFLLSALAINGFLSFMRRFRRHFGTVERILGVVLIATGLLFITGTIAEVSYWLLEAFPVLGRIG